MTKRIIGLALALMLVLSCMSFTTAALADEPRNITIGVWWDIYYDSNQEDITDNPSYQGTVSDQLMWEVVDEIEQKYNVTFEYVNMTYTGVSESINTSILAGTPDCDIYMCELQFGMPAVVNGYAMDMHDVLPADSDLFTEQKIMTYLDLNDGHAYLFKPAAAEDQVANTYPLAFNKQMLEDANLEDPNELYARGEWTWDKFIEYCQTLTKDTDGDGITDSVEGQTFIYEGGDGAIDVYGFGGCQAEWFYNLIMSNGTYIARGDVENWSSKEVGEVLQLMQDMYLTYNCAYPYPTEWDGSWDIMRYLYRDGKVAFVEHKTIIVATYGNQLPHL